MEAKNWSKQEKIYEPTGLDCRSFCLAYHPTTFAMLKTKFLFNIKNRINN
jgi:hypothetical protein